MDEGLSHESDPEDEDYDQSSDEEDEERTRYINASHINVCPSALKRPADLHVSLTFMR